MLYVDIPTSSDLLALTEQRHEISVSLYLPTTPVSLDADATRIALKSMGRDVVQRLERDGSDAHQVAALEEHIRGLVEDHDFWRFQANSLAVFATPEHIRSYRLPSALETQLQISDRFQLGQLLRAVTFPNAGFVLVLAEGEARLIEVSADASATTLTIPELPEDVEPFTSAPVADRLPRLRAQGTLGDQSAQRQFARRINSVVRDRLRGSGLPLVLSATEPMASIYRTMNTYPRLAQTLIDRMPGLSDAALAQRARTVFDAVYRDELSAWRRQFDERTSQGRSTTDVASAARAATFGAIDSILIDMTATVEGSLSEEDGTLNLAGTTTVGRPGQYNVLGEIAARVIRSNGQVLAVRSDDIPNGARVAAILRYAV
ncbi:MAG: hypothetical protein ABI255_00385 [Microbacteriaceae bacterium]